MGAVDEGHEPERIEIELTPHDPEGSAARARRARVVSADGDASVTEAGEPGGPGWFATERGRLLGVGAGAALVALIVGVLVGRLGAGGVESSGEAVTTTVVATSTTTTTGNRDTLPRAPDVLSPTTTRPDRTTTTTTPVSADGWTEGSVVVNPEFEAEQVEVVALVGQGVLVRIDATTGATSSTQTDAGFGQPYVSAGDGWVLVPDDRGGFESVADDGARTALDLGGWWPALTSGAAAWRAEFDQGLGGLTRLVQVSFDGTETGEVIDVDGFYPVAVDPLGGVVVQASGGYYVVAPDSRERLTTGMLHALGVGTALVHECDDQLECGYFVIDRSSGARDPLGIDAQESENLEFGGFGWWSLGSPMSPTEDALVVITFGAQGPALGVLDLTTGSYTELRRFENEPQAAWSPSGRYLYWVDGGTIMVFDRSTGESVPFSDDLDRVVALDVRPLAGAIE